jgi:hypothetical protein
MDPSVLTVYTSPYPKIRLGKNHDGGYVVIDVPEPKYSVLLAGGVSNDISFEEHFIRKYGSRCIAFDGTINSLPNNNNNIRFVKKNIGFNNTNALTNLHDIIAANTNIFIKMDIEGGEIPWIKSLSNDQMNKFEQIVMEFHNPYSKSEIEVFDKINKNHILVHFHGNNACGTRTYKGIIMPNIFECTYLHKKYFTSGPELNKIAIPTSIDMRNIPHNNEIHINYPPFVHNGPTEKCVRAECTFLRHTAIRNNGGTHCCYACKNNASHGPMCQRITPTTNPV